MQRMSPDTVQATPGPSSSLVAFEADSRHGNQKPKKKLLSPRPQSEENPDLSSCLYPVDPRFVDEFEKGRFVLHIPENMLSPTFQFTTQTVADQVRKYIDFVIEETRTARRKNDERLLSQQKLLTEFNKKHSSVLLHVADVVACLDITALKQAAMIIRAPGDDSFKQTFYATAQAGRPYLKSFDKAAITEFITFAVKEILNKNIQLKKIQEK